MAPHIKVAPKPAPRKGTPGTDKTRPSRYAHFTVDPNRLQSIIQSGIADVKQESEPKETKAPSTGSDTPVAPTSHKSDEVAGSSPATPGAGGTPAPAVMGPPGEGQGPKKKGVKRAAVGANGSDPSDPASKIKARPGPKKRQRMDDGTIEPKATGASAPRLGPKANQGAINDRLRALDRSGKPCRRWQRGGFKLKSFTGVAWEISRWSAPPKMTPPSSSTPEDGASASASADGGSSSNKENGDASKDKPDIVMKSDDNSNVSMSGDAEARSLPSINASSPAPMPVAVGA